MTGIYERLSTGGAAEEGTPAPFLYVLVMTPSPGLRLALPLPAGWRVAPAAPGALRQRQSYGQSYGLLGPRRLRVALTVSPASAGPTAQFRFAQPRTVSRGVIAGPQEPAYYTLAALPAPLWRVRGEGLLTVEWRCPANQSAFALTVRGGAPEDLEPLLRCLPYLRCDVGPVPD